MKNNWISIIVLDFAMFLMSFSYQEGDKLLKIKTADKFNIDTVPLWGQSLNNSDSCSPSFNYFCKSGSYEDIKDLYGADGVATVRNKVGSVVLTSAVHGRAEVFKRLQCGVYYVTVETEQGTGVKKLIIE